VILDQDHSRQLRQQTALAQFGELALHSDDLDEILTEACRLVGEALGTDFAKVVELQPDGNTLLVRAGVGWTEGVVGVATIQATDDTSEGYALKTGEPMISPDIDEETRFRYPDFLITYGVKAVANVIIIGGTDRPPFGILQVDSRVRREFSEEDVAFLRTYANLIAATVERLSVLNETRDASTRLRLALEAGDLGSFEMDVASGHITSSDRYDSIFGIVSVEKSWTWNALLEQVVPEDRAGIADAMRSALAESGELRVEFRIERAEDSAPRWIELRGRLDDQGDSPPRIVGIAADITDRKLAEQALVMSNGTLEAQVSERTNSLAESNAQLDAFAYTVSHDLRAPLRAMEGFARILQEDHGAGLGEEGYHYASRIVGAAKRMEGLIDDLLAFSRVQRADVTMKWTDPARAIRNAITELRSAGFDESAVTLKVTPSFPPIKADGMILAQVIGNLVLNAAKFKAPDRSAHVTIRAERCAERVRIWVEDNGIGIAPEHQARIFNVFERLHGQETYPGTGVGLAIVKAGVERMGGTCGVEGDLGVGSRFWIELDAAENSAGEGMS